MLLDSEYQLDLAGREGEDRNREWMEFPEY